MERLVANYQEADQPAERQQIVSDVVQTGALQLLAYKIFADHASPAIYLDWNSGKIVAFITEVFTRLNMPVPPQGDMYALYTRFDSDGDWALDVEEGARLIEAAVCSVAGIEATAERPALHGSLEPGRVQELVGRLFAIYDVQEPRGMLPWHTGEAKAFLLDVFRNLGLSEPTDMQIAAMQQNFAQQVGDTQGTYLLQGECHLLVEALCRTMSHVEAADAAMTCPNGHVMKLFVTPIAGYQCNMCASTFQPSIALWECRIDDFHMCTVCAKSRRRGNTVFAEVRGGDF